MQVLDLFINVHHHLILLITQSKTHAQARLMRALASPPDSMGSVWQATALSMSRVGEKFLI